MKLFVPHFFRWHPIFSMISLSILIGLLVFLCNFLYVNYINPDTRVPTSLIGVHHLGSDYRIQRFYVNKSINDSIDEGGGGGSMVCCLTLPREWSSKLTADVRWEVQRIIKNSPSNIPKAELVGIYQAQVPVERYSRPGDFYVHFFPEGHVRIVVSEMTSSSDQHPILWGDLQAIQLATNGKFINSFFTSEEISEFERQSALDKKKYGDWR